MPAVSIPGGGGLEAGGGGFVAQVAKAGMFVAVGITLEPGGQSDASLSLSSCKFSCPTRSGQLPVPSVSLPFKQTNKYHYKQIRTLVKQYTGTNFPRVLLTFCVGFCTSKLI